MNRICKRCLVEKDLETNFYISRNTRVWQCKECIVEMHKSPEKAEQRRQCEKRRRQDGGEEFLQKERNKRNRNIVSVLVGDARRRAKKTGLEFSITKYDLKLVETCPILGIPIELSNTNLINSPSIDRIDNTKGYVPGNVIIVSTRANILKRDASLEELWLIYNRNKEIHDGHKLEDLIQV